MVFFKYFCYGIHFVVQKVPEGMETGNEILANSFKRNTVGTKYVLRSSIPQSASYTSHSGPSAGPLYQPAPCRNPPCSEFHFHVSSEWAYNYFVNTGTLWSWWYFIFQVCIFSEFLFSKNISDYSILGKETI